MFQAQDQESYYDFHKDILNRSPPLIAIKLNIESQDAPPALSRIRTSSDSPDTEDTDVVRSSRRPKGPKSLINPSFGDGVLIRSLDPNQRELAWHVARNPLDPDRNPEEEEDNDAPGSAGQQQRSKPREVVQSQASQIATGLASVAKENPLHLPPNASAGTRRGSHQEQVQTASPLEQENPLKKQFDTRPPPLKEGLGLNLKPSHGHEEVDEDSMVTSPTLGKFAITRNDAPPDFILPALQQKSPPRSLPPGFLDQKPSLPSLKTAIGDLQDASFVEFATMSPMRRPPHGHFTQYTPPAPYSAMLARAPMGPPFHDYSRTTTRDSDTLISPSSSNAASTSSSSITAPSPATSNPSPLEPLSKQNRDRTRRESFDETELKSQLESQPKVPLSSRILSGAYKCTYDECTAAPFQTQYLLNSHMNVHSNRRTHFCPIKGCPWGPDGQGFKRKNEMIRHGLVHASPGYICPFCPDQHKYPRPDNLQRHVRQHHEDIEQHDPILRDILNQRLEGGSRGGRRRMR